MSADIINFPKSKVYRAVPNEQLLKGKQRNIQENIEVIVDEVGTELMLHLEHYGISAENDAKTERDFLFIYDLLRAILYRKAGIPHHLHDFLDKSLSLSPLSELLPKTFPEEFVVTTAGEGLDKEAERAVREIIEAIEEARANGNQYDDIPSDVEPEDKT